MPCSQSPPLLLVPPPPYTQHLLSLDIHYLHLLEPQHSHVQARFAQHLKNLLVGRHSSPVLGLLMRGKILVLPLVGREQSSHSELNVP